MPFYLAHATSKLQKLSVAGTVSDLTLPTGVTMSSTRRTRFAMLNDSLMAVHGPSINVRVRTSDFETRPMSLIGPSTVPTVAAGAAGSLTGAYKYKVSFCEVVSGSVVSESPLSSATATLTLAAQKGSLTSIPVSTDTTVTDRRLYRTTVGGDVYFPLAFIADNTTTTYTDDTADASLGTTAADTDLGNPAGSTTGNYLTLLTAWRDRLWAVSNDAPDNVPYSGINKWYAWAPLNFLTINPKGQGSSGITAFMARRDELGVAKRRSISKIIGNSVDNYQVVNVINGVGVFAPESVVVIRDTAYFLSEDGPYSWGPEGITPLSTERTAAWFTTDTYFNRTRFANAFAVWNQTEDTYELHLAGASSGTEDRWVTYDLQRKLWLGPHKTDAFTPTCAATMEDIDGRAILLMGGSDANVYRANDVIEQSDGTTAIDYDVTTAFASGGEPTLEKYWGEVVISNRPQAAGTLTVTPYVGSQASTAGTDISVDLTKDRTKGHRVGVGRLMKLRFRQNTASQGAQVLGYEVSPVTVVGRR